MSQEAFQILSRGGILLNKSSSKNFIKPVQSNKPENSQSSGQGLPLELDFFKYTQAAHEDEKQVEHYHKRTKTSTEHIPQDNSRRSELPVLVKGLKIPTSIDSLDALRGYGNNPIPGHVFANLMSAGYRQLTSVQAHCIPILLQDRDLVAVSPTGTGKTLAYLIPMFSKLAIPISGSKSEESKLGVRAVIISPTVDLAHQIHNECLKLALGRKWRVVLFDKANSKSLSPNGAQHKVDIIVSTPLRLANAIQEGTMDLNSVQLLVFDEADRLLDSEFLDQIMEIYNSCNYPNLQKAFFSATLPANAKKIAMELLLNPINVTVGQKDTSLPLISQSLTYVADDHSKLPSLLNHLSQPFTPPVIVFTSSQSCTTSLTGELILHGISKVDCLHAGLTKRQREDAVKRMRNGETWVMVTTEVLARGIDFKGIREVINYDCPRSVQSYIHRIGRTGRAGRKGKAVTFFTNDDVPYIKMVSSIMIHSGSAVPEWINNLPKKSKIKRRQEVPMATL